MANFFDQFDEQQEKAPSASSAGGNFFDQFDETEAQTPSYNPFIDPEPTADQSRPALDRLMNEKGQITSQAYDGMTFEQARGLYEEAINDPRVQNNENFIQQAGNKLMDAFGLGGDNFGTPTYNGDKIPAPELETGLGAIRRTHEGKAPMATVSAQTLSGEGIINAPQELYNTGAALANRGIEAVTGARDTLPLADPKYTRAEGVVDSLAQTAVPIIAGGAGGVKLGREVVERVAPATSAAVTAGTASRTQRLGVAAAEGTAAAVGTTALLDNDISGLFAGDEAAFGKWAEVVAKGENESASAEIVRKKTNLLVDALATSAGAAPIAAGAGKGLNWVGEQGMRLGRMFFGDSQERLVGDMVLQRLSGIDPNDVKAVEAWKNDTTEILRRFSDYSAKTMDEGLSKNVEGRLAPMDAIVRGRSTPKIIDEATGELIDNPYYDPVAFQRAANTRQTLYENTPEGQAIPERYVKEAEDFRSDIIQSGGGDEGMETARRGITRSVDEEVGSARALAADVEATEDQVREATARLLQEDPRLSEDVARIAEETGITTTASRNAQTADDVIQTVLDAEQIQHGQMLRYLDEIPTGVQVSPDYKLAVEVAQEENLLGSLTPAAREALETGDFKQIHNVALPEMQIMIRNQGDKAPQAVKKLRDDLLGKELDLLSDSAELADEAAVEAATRFRDYARETYYSNFGDGYLKQIRDTFKGSTMPTTDGGRVFTNVGSERIATDDMRKTLKQYIEPGNAEQIKTLVEIGGDTPEARKGVFDIIKAKAVEKLDLDGPIDETSLKAFKDELSTYSKVLRDSYPDEVVDLDNFIRSFETGQRRAGSLREEAIKLGDAADVAEARLRGTGAPFQQFYKRVGGETVERRDAQKVFRDIFKPGKDTPITPVKDVVDRAKEIGPEATDGVHAAFGEYILYEDITKANKKQVLDIVDTVYDKAEYPETNKAIKQFYDILELSKQGQGNRSDFNEIVGTIRDQAQGAARRVINLVFGPLNRVGARLNVGASMIGETLDPAEAVKRNLGEIASNPESFERMLQGVNQSNIFENPREIALFLMRAGIYNDRDSAEAAIMEEGANDRVGSAFDNDDESWMQ